MSKKDINITHLGLRKSFFGDLYYHVLKTSWSKFFLIAAFTYLLMNFLFALIYFYSPAQILNVRADSIWDAFLFSFQTSSTLGYGYFLPNSVLAHIIVLLDTIIGIFYVAIVTGLAYAKFSKPSAKVIFSDKAIITTFDGVPALMFRMANNRNTHIVDASLNVAVLLPYTSSEGHTLRRFHPLNLLSNQNPTFSLSWTAIHIMDETSPLKDMSLERLHELQALIIVSLTGIDDVISQTINVNYRYKIDSIIRAKKFTDIVTVDKDNHYTVDFEKFNLTESL